MKRLQLVIAVAAACLSSAAMATSSVTYSNLATTSSGVSGNGATTLSNGTTYNGWEQTPSFAQYCANGAAGCAAGGGSNYGNSYSFGSSVSSTGTGPSFSISAYGTQSVSTTAQLQKAWVGNYGGNGFGVTSQSPGELTAGNMPDTAGPNYQHALDNTQAYESLLFSFASAVTVNGLSIGFKGADADATVLEYTGSGDPTASLTLAATGGYAGLLANGWKLVGNILDMSTSTSNPDNFNSLTTSGSVASKYWMVGAYIPNIGTNGAGDSNIDSFKVNGISLVGASSVPEPGSIALLGIAGAALALSRRRARRA
jgi:hypothetical protein